MGRLVAAVAVLCALAPAAHAARRTHPTHQFTTATPGAPTGRVYTLRVADPGDPPNKPAALGRVELTLPRGARFDTTAIPACGANDAQLLLGGAGACPPRSRLGATTMVLDTGANLLTADFALLNAPGQLLFVGAATGTPLPLVLRAAVGGRRLALDIPLLPGTLPDGAALRSEHAQVRRARRYLRTPPRCPAGRRWITRLAYTFRDGKTERASAGSPCVRRR